MQGREVVKAASRKTGQWLWSFADMLPPYNVAEGIVDEKVVGSDGLPIIRVNKARVSVDRSTYDMLTVGDRLRVRYTRSARAISIDRYVAPNGSGQP